MALARCLNSRGREGRFEGHRGRRNVVSWAPTTPSHSGSPHHPTLELRPGWGSSERLTGGRSASLGRGDSPAPPEVSWGRLNGPQNLLAGRALASLHSQAWGPAIPYPVAPGAPRPPPPPTTLHRKPGATDWRDLRIGGCRVEEGRPPCIIYDPHHSPNREECIPTLQRR